MPGPPVTPHLQPGPYLMSNIVSSVQAVLDSTIVTPYNAAVTGTHYSKPIQVLLEYPDDLLLVSTVPAIVLEDPIDMGPVWGTGQGDMLVWNKTQIMMCVYPGLFTDPSSGSQNASVQSAYILRSLFKSLTTQLTIGLTDFTTVPTPTLVDYAYHESKIIDIKGKMPVLALVKRRFDFSMTLRFAVGTQNGY